MQSKAGGFLIASRLRASVSPSDYCINIPDMEYKAAMFLLSQAKGPPPPKPKDLSSHQRRSHFVASPSGPTCLTRFSIDLISSDLDLQFVFISDFDYIHFLSVDWDIFCHQSAVLIPLQVIQTLQKSKKRMPKTC